MRLGRQGELSLALLNLRVRAIASGVVGGGTWLAISLKAIARVDCSVGTVSLTSCTASVVVVLLADLDAIDLLASAHKTQLLANAAPVGLPEHQRTQARLH